MKGRRKRRVRDDSKATGTESEEWMLLEKVGRVGEGEEQERGRRRRRRREEREVELLLLLLLLVRLVVREEEQERRPPVSGIRRTYFCVPRRFLSKRREKDSPEEGRAARCSRRTSIERRGNSLSSSSFPPSLGFFSVCISLFSSSIFRP